MRVQQQLSSCAVLHFASILFKTVAAHIYIAMQRALSRITFLFSRRRRRMNLRMHSTACAPSQMRSGADLGRKIHPAMHYGDRTHREGGALNQWGWIDPHTHSIRTAICHCTRKIWLKHFLETFHVRGGCVMARPECCRRKWNCAKRWCFKCDGTTLSAQWTIVYAVLFVVVLQWKQITQPLSWLIMQGGRRRSLRALTQ